MSRSVGIAVTPRQLDPSGLAGHLARNYGAAFQRLGLTPVYGDLGSPDEAGLRRLLAPDVDLLFSHGGWLYSDWQALGAQGGALARQANKPSIVLVADPTFSPWMPPMLAALPGRAMPFFIDPSFAEGVGPWIASGAHAPYLPCRHTLEEPGFGQHGPVPTAEKTIPGLFVGTAGDPREIYDRLKESPDFDQVAKPIIERSLDDPFWPLAYVAKEVFRTLGIPFDLSRETVRARLIGIDQFIRLERRARMLQALCRHDVHIVAQGVLHLPRQRRATLLDAVDFPGMLELLRRTKVLYVCQPHYPGALNERIVFAMQARALVVATPNGRTRQCFEHGRHLFLTAPDLSDLDRWVAAAADETAAEPMRDAALQRIADGFAPEDNIRYMLGRMRAAGLVDGGIAAEIGPQSGPQSGPA